MKTFCKAKIIVVLLLLCTNGIQAQTAQIKLYQVVSAENLNSKPGLINITEVNMGIGLFQTNRDYSKRFYNISDIFGIGILKNLIGGIGIGVSLYNGGSLIPLFVDLRYFINIGKISVFAFGDGGILLNSAKTTGGTKILINPGAGVALPVSKNLSVNLGAGLFVNLMKDYATDSFVSIKAGMTYYF